MSDASPESCPLCPPSGPPSHPRSSTSAARPNDSGKAEGPTAHRPQENPQLPSLADGVENDDDDDDDDTVLSWIYCPKCKEWYHGVCILSTSDETRVTVPEPVREHIEKEEEGVWTNWTGWVDKWFCHKCLAQSRDPANPRPPRFPLVATINSTTFPPKPKVTKQPKPSKRSSQMAEADAEPAEPKKRKVERAGRDEDNSDRRRRSSGGANQQSELAPAFLAAEPRRDSLNDGEVHLDRNGATHPLPSLPSPSPDDDRSVVAETKEGLVDAQATRPKRQAALNRPDYHALHHHIATPTARWLDLIHHPEKYNAKIIDGNFPRVPAAMVRRQWLDAPLDPSTQDSSAIKADGAPWTPPMSDSNAQSSSPKYPPHLPSDLYYGPRREPLIITPEDGGFEGLGGSIPGKEFSVQDVARLVGPDRMVDVIDVATQQSSQWTLKKWAEYVSSKFGSNANSIPGADPSSSKVYNVISLEISGTQLADMVRPPKLVSEIDWVDNCWNFGPGGKETAVREDMAAVRGQKMEGEKAKGKGKAREPWPKVQLYCLMGAKGSWTDWHVDFAASSVYYTIHTGAKTFFFIRPTQKNLAAYAEWSGSYEKQQNVWLGDMCDEVRKVELRQGDTMMIPAGYIHSVYTPEDSIVFGGNFLHSYDIPTQLRLRQIEIDTKVPQRFRFPFFDKLCWYVAEKHCAQLRQLRLYRAKAAPSSDKPPSPRVLHGLVALADFLISQCDIMEDVTAEEKRRKLIHDRIPNDVKDGPALARELKWRAERELPGRHDVEEHLGSSGKDGLAKVKKESGGDRGVSAKRASSLLPRKAKSRVWNFHPPPWEETVAPVEHISRKVAFPLSSEGDGAQPTTAQEEITIKKQKRTRRRYLEDGTVVWEEQDYVLTERKVVQEPVKREGVEAGGVSPLTGGAGDGDGTCVD